jgi:hypothetical protein
MTTTAVTGTYVAMAAWGAVSVTITPTAAVTAGAKWQIDSGEWQESAAVLDGLSIGSHTLAYRAATGYTTLASEKVVVVSGVTTSLARVYVATASAVSMARPPQRLANLPYPFGFKSLEEVRDYLIKLRSKLGEADFSVTQNDIVYNDTTTTTGAGAEHFIELHDVPQTYAGAGGKFPVVNTAVNALYFNPYVLLSETAPSLTIRNLSDAGADPVLHWSLGATPVVKYTMGVDDSSIYQWKLATGDEFGPDHDVLVLTPGAGEAHAGVDFTLIDSWPTPLSGTSESPYGLCSDGTYFYYTVAGTSAIVKVSLDTATEIARVVDMDYPQPWKIVTDKTYLYALCINVGNIVVRKYNCSDLVHIATSGEWSDQGLRGICYFAGHLYVTVEDSYWSPTCKVVKINCVDLSTEWTKSFDRGTGTGQMHDAWGIATDGQYIFVADYGTENRIIRLDMDGVWVDAYDTGDATNATNPSAIWCAGDNLYYGKHIDGAGAIEWRNRGDLTTIVGSQVILPATDHFLNQGFLSGDFHYLVSSQAAGTTIYKYQYTPSYELGEAALQIRLRNAWGDMVDVARFTGKTRLGVGTTTPTETIEAAGNIKATGKFITGSSAIVTNLNSDAVDGYHHDQSLLTTAGPKFGEVVLTPKASSSSTAEGTMFYCSSDNQVYVAVE